MLRRTLFAFLALLFLVLAITLGYAALGLSGPDTAIQNAARAFAADRYGACVRTLDLAEQGLGPDPDPRVLRRILEIRHEAYYALGNVHSALRDLAALREFESDDVDLAQRQVRWTIEAGDPLRGLELAEARLAEHPDEPRTLELAGEACQARYQELVRDFLAEYATLLDQKAATKAFEALRTWLYRDEDDPAAAEGFQAFEAVLRERRPTAFAAGDYAVALQEIRGLVTRAQRYFREALEADAQPVAAYLGLGYALRQGGRQDDRQWLGEIYLHRFDHEYTTLAAVDLAEMHLAAGRHRAVHEVARRFLPPDRWSERAAEGGLLPEVRDLLLADARALLALGDTAALDALSEEVQQIQAEGVVDLMPEMEWILAIGAIARKDYRTASRHLRDYDVQLRGRPPTEEIVSRRIAVFEQLIELARIQNWGPEFFEWAFRSLSGIDESNPQYFVERSRLRLDGNDVEGALLDLRTARTLAEHDDNVLMLQAKAVDTQQARSGRDSASQLRRCIELGLTVPYDIDELLLLPLAERAFEERRYEIALASAERASIAFNWARWPRELAARAALALERFDLAEQFAEALLAHHPGDLRGLEHLREARERQGLPIDDLTYDLLVAGEADSGIAASLLKAALHRGDVVTAAHLADSILRRWPEDAAALLPVAEAQRLRGDIEAARRTLQRAADTAAESNPEIYAQATHRYFLLSAAAGGEPAEIERLFRRALDVARTDTGRLTDLARQLHENGLDDLAFRVLSVLLSDDRHRAARTGPVYSLAGELALRLGRKDRAEQYLLAALTFPDSQAASRSLALLFLAEGRNDAAAESYWDAEVVDLVSACLSARAGRVEPALKWARARAASSGADLQARAVLALFGRDATPGPELAELVDSAREELLDVLTFLEADGFAAEALRHAEELVSKAPANLFARTLLARAHAGVGDRKRGLEILSGVIDESPLLVPAYDAAAEMLEQPFDSELAVDELVDRFLDPEVIRKGLATTDMVELATRREAVRLIATIGDRPEAIEALAALWQFAPGADRFGLQYVELLAQFGRVDLALELCQAFEPRIRPELREPFYVLWFHLLGQRIAATDDADLRSSAMAEARRFIQRDGALGVLVHFLIDQDVAMQGPLSGRADAERINRIRNLLEAHLRRIRAGEERFDASVVATLRRIYEVSGRSRAIALAESLLREDPSQVGLWIARAEWLVEENHVDEAVGSVAWMKDYLPTSPAILGSVELAARAGRSNPDDDERLRRDLDPALLETPSAAHVLGLLAFREADYSEARELLRRGGPRPDGAHLYFGGLAALIEGDATDARHALEQLERDYPRSSLSFNAGHFARQLVH